MFIASDAWKATYPGARAGILAMKNVANPAHHLELDQRKEMIEQSLRDRFAGADRAAIRALPIIQAYNAYYKRFKKTYHVQLQLESVALKGKSLPRVAALVEAMFMAEIKNMILTAGHDLDKLVLPITVDVARGTEQYTMLNGKEQTLKKDDMMMTDREGVITSVIYGLDQRTCISGSTRSVVFAVYAPAGIEDGPVRDHLRDIETNVRLVAPNAETLALEVRCAE